MIRAIKIKSRLVADKLFATLDPTSRRLRFPTEVEVILTDTVGFIRNLPAELVQAFMATLEELEEADLLVHVIDVSNPSFRQQMTVVDKILGELELGDIPILKLFNKIDRVEDEQAIRKIIGDEGLVVSAVNSETLGEFLGVSEKMIGKALDGNLR